MTRREELIAELAKINFYWRELSEGRSEDEIEKIITELKQARQMIKGIFNFKVMINRE